MKATLESTYYMHLAGREIDALRNILALAAERLASSPVHQMHGTPHKLQAGLKATDLLNTKEMLLHLTASLGMPEPKLEPSEANPIAVLLALAGVAGPLFAAELKNKGVL